MPDAFILITPSLHLVFITHDRFAVTILIEWLSELQNSKVELLHYTFQQLLEHITEIQPDIVVIDIANRQTEGEIEADFNSLLTTNNSVSTLFIFLKQKDLLNQENMLLNNQKHQEVHHQQFIILERPQSFAFAEGFEQRFMQYIRNYLWFRLEKLEHSEVISPSSEIHSEHDFSLVVIGSSTGGPSILTDFFRRLPSGLPYCFFIVQHFPLTSFFSDFVEHLKVKSTLEITTPNDYTVLHPGKAFVIPSNAFLSIEKNDQGVFLLRMEIMSGQKISATINPVMKVAAQVFGKRAIGIVLTGMGNDGLEGARQIKAHDGSVIVQKPDTCVVDSMPQNIVKAGLADFILTPWQIVQKLSDQSL